MYALINKVDAWLKTSKGWNLALVAAPLLAIGLVATCFATPFFIIKPLTCALFHPPPDLKPLSSYPRAQQLTAQQFPVTSPLVLSQTIMFQTDDSPAAVLGFYSGTLTAAKWWVGSADLDSILFQWDATCNPWFHGTIRATPHSQRPTTVEIMLFSGNEY